MSMKPMTWKEYFDGFDDWQTSTQVRYLERLSDAGPADEVTQVALDLLDAKASDRLVRFALSRGVHFSLANVYDLESTVSNQTLNDAARSIRERVTEQQLAELEYLVDDEVYTELLHRNGYRTEDEKEAAELEAIEREMAQEERSAIRRGPKMGLLGTLFHMWALAKEEPERAEKSAWKTLTAGNSRHCGGDCAHCPPHYGYREGRWYYGHHHSYGCELGGNKRE